MADVRDQLQAAISGGDVIERELGGGDMSRVFVVEERRLGRSVAIKVLAPELPAGINAERFQREIRLAASLQQANIIPVLVASESKRLPYFTMPFVEGRSLRARLGTGPLPVAEAIGILRDIARALDYATRTVWCTATSSPTTCCCPMARRWSPTSVSPRRSRARACRPPARAIRAR